MGLFSDSVSYEYLKNKIEVEGRSTLEGIEFDLIINNEKIDKIKGYFGKMTLRGKIKENENDIPIIIRIRQGFFGAKYHLEVNGKLYKMNKVY